MYMCLMFLHFTTLKQNYTSTVQGQRSLEELGKCPPSLVSHLSFTLQFMQEELAGLSDGQHA